MAPANIDLDKTRRWLAQLRTTNLTQTPSAESTSPGSSIDERNVSPTSSPSSASEASNTTTPPSSPLTETRAKSLQRLCEIGGCDTADSLSSPPSGSASKAIDDINARFPPTNINYIKSSELGGWSVGGNADIHTSPDASPTRGGRSRWSRGRQSQTLHALERDTTRRFSLSRFRLRP